jgi:hypothetical protein
MCCLEAISGTTPPYSLCISICEEILLDKISFPSFNTAMEVSSQELSIPKIIIKKPPFLSMTYFLLYHFLRKKALF